jgi:hypothetical protein
VGRERERERERESCCCNEEELAAIVYEEDQLLDQLLVMLLNAELVCVDDDLARLLLLVAELCGVPGRFRSGFAASRQRHSPAPQSLEIRLRQVALLVPPHHISIRTWRRRRRRSRSHPNMHFSISLSRWIHSLAENQY